jgi:hypothetical protein
VLHGSGSATAAQVYHKTNETAIDGELMNFTVDYSTTSSGNIRRAEVDAAFIQRPVRRLQRGRVASSQPHLSVMPPPLEGAGNDAMLACNSSLDFVTTESTVDPAPTSSPGF